MTEQGDPTTGQHNEHDPKGWLILGIALVAAGAFFGASSLGIVPWPVTEAWGFAVRARSGIGIILVGVLLIIWAQSGHSFTAPKRGTKLYKKRDEKWVAGVLGGVAEYFGVDATLLRLAFLALVLMFDIGGLVVAYIVMAILVPEEPKTPAATAAPAAVASPAPAPPAPPLPPVEQQTSAEGETPADPTTWA